MKKFPLDRYRFFVCDGNKVVAVSSYAGEKVTGTAKCAPEDTFSLEKGKELAAARCNVKVAKRRYNRAREKSREASNELTSAIASFTKNMSYFDDSLDALMGARRDLKNVMLDL